MSKYSFVGNMKPYKVLMSDLTLMSVFHMAVLKYMTSSPPGELCGSAVSVIQYRLFFPKTTKDVSFSL